MNETTRQEMSMENFHSLRGLLLRIGGTLLALARHCPLPSARLSR
jgi:hypothetical protein